MGCIASKLGACFGKSSRTLPRLGELFVKSSDFFGGCSCKVNSKLEKGLMLVVFQNKVKLKHVYSNIRWLLWGIVLDFNFDILSVLAHIHNHN